MPACEACLISLRAPAGVLFLSHSSASSGEPDALSNGRDGPVWGFPGTPDTAPLIRNRAPDTWGPHTLPLPAPAGACRLAGTRLMRVQRRSCTAAHRLTLLQTGWKESSSRSSGHATHPREGKRSPREVGPGSYRLVPGVNHAFPADSAWPELSEWFLCGHPAGTRGKLPSCCMSNYTATRAGSAPPDQRVSGGQVRRPRAPGRSCL